MIEFKQINKLRFELDEFHPDLFAEEVRIWLFSNGIDHKYIYNHGPSEIYDRAYFQFKNEEDAMAFKLRWC